MNEITARLSSALRMWSDAEYLYEDAQRSQLRLTARMTCISVSIRSHLNQQSTISGFLQRSTIMYAYQFTLFPTIGRLEYPLGESVLCEPQTAQKINGKARIVETLLATSSSVNPGWAISVSQTRSRAGYTACCALLHALCNIECRIPRV